MNPNSDFSAIMGKVATELYHGLTWHCEAANQMRKIGLRGFGRLHEYNGKHDFERLGELKKILGDRLEIYPDIDASNIPKALTFTMNNVSDLKPHLEAWCNAEYAFCETLKTAVKMAADEDMCVYSELIGILNDVEEEIMRLNILKKRLAIGEYGGHDIARVSKDLHKHFEHHPERGLDFDV